MLGLLRTHFRTVCVVQTILHASELITAHRAGWSPLLPSTSRTACSRTSDEQLAAVVFVVMASPSSGLEPRKTRGDLDHPDLESTSGKGYGFRARHIAATLVLLIHISDQHRQGRVTGQAFRLMKPWSEHFGYFLINLLDGQDLAAPLKNPRVWLCRSTHND